MPTEPQPPVNEVVFALGFEPVESLAGIRVGSTVKDLVDDFPRTEVHPPYQMQLEQPPSKGIASGVGLRFDMLTSGQYPPPRYWLISADDIRLIQIQNNYAAFNWRRSSFDQEYPGYTALNLEFNHFQQKLTHRISENGESLTPRQVELTYVNILRPGILWSSFSDLHNVLTIKVHGMEDFDQLGFAFSKVIEYPDRNFAGRVSVSAQPGVDIATGDPALNVTLVARSGRLPGTHETEVADFINLAHTEITKLFTSLTTDSARRVWVLQ